MNDELKVKAFKASFLQAEIVLERGHVYYRYSKYLNSPETTFEQEIIQHNEFLRESRIAFLISTVLDLCILVDSKGDYSLNKMLNIILGENIYPRLVPKIKEWQQQIQSQRVTINKLFSIRDKHYAHLDSKRGDIMISMPTYEEFEQLFKVIATIFGEIHLEVYNCDMTYSAFFPDSIKSVLDSINYRVNGI